MSWATVSAAIQTHVASVPDCGPFYVGELHIRDLGMFDRLFRWVRTLAGVPVSGAKDSIRGWRLIRETVDEGFPGIDSTGYRRAVERYKFRFLSAVVGGEAQTETQAQEVLDAVWARLRGVTTIGDALVIGAAETPSVGHVKYGPVLCHYSELGLEVVERLAIPAADPINTSDALHSRRDTYENIAEQIAGYLETMGTDAGTVHRERPVGHTPGDRDEILAVESEVTPGKQTLRGWTVHRSSDRETRGIGNRVTAESVWTLVHWRAWHDVSGSYDAAMVHVDQARAVFRGLGNLGNTLNPTQVLSSPLQVVRVLARNFMGAFCHVIECEIKIEEVVHV